jgi:aminoglycoside 6'-N-acetyltransferase I
MEGRVTLEIRELGPADFALWADCAHALWPETPRDTLLAEIRVQAGPGLGQARAWAAFRDGVPVGWAELGLRPYANGCDDRPVAFLEACWVAPEARRTGVGRALIRRLAELARSGGRSELGSDALIDNLASHAAHRAWGFAETERVVHFRLPL